MERNEERLVQNNNTYISRYTLGSICRKYQFLRKENSVCNEEWNIPWHPKFSLEAAQKTPKIIQMCFPITREELRSCTFNYECESILSWINCRSFFSKEIN